LGSTIVRTLLVAGAAGMSAAAVAVALGGPDVGMPPTAAPPAGVAAPQLGAHVAYIDPRTGALVAEPPPGVEALELGMQELNMLSRSAAALPIRRSAHGGMSVDLQGRFRHMTVATIDEDGAIDSHCVRGDSLTSEDAQ